MQKRWRTREPEKTLSSDAFPQFHPVAVRLLANRGITDAFDA